MNLACPRREHSSSSSSSTPTASPNGTRSSAGGPKPSARSTPCAGGCSAPTGTGPGTTSRSHTGLGQDRHRRLADTHAGEQRLHVVEGGLGERRDGGLERLGVLRRERAQGVLDAV